MQIRIIQDLHTRKFDSRFPTPWLSKDRMKWELLQDFIIEVDGVRHVVPKGYVFDGSSTPRIAWLIYPPSHPCAWKGSAIHDFGLSHLFKERPQDYWDDVLYHFILKEGGKSYTAWIFRKSVGLAPRGGYRYA